MEQRKSATRWAWIVCCWPLLPIVPVIVLGGNWLAAVLFFALYTPAYAIWAGLGLLFAGVLAAQRSELSRIALAVNGGALVVSGVAMWLGYGNWLSLSWS